MLKDLPVTHYFDFGKCNDVMRQYIMREFAGAGARCLVLASCLVREIQKNPEFAFLLKEEMKATGLTFLDSHAPNGCLENLNIPFEEARENMIARQKLAILTAAQMGVRHMTFHVGDTPAEYKPFSVEYLTECARKTLTELLPVAEKSQVTIAIENGCSPTSAPDVILALVESLNHPFLGVCYDSGHAHMMDSGRNFTESVPHHHWLRYTDSPIRWESRCLEKLLPYVTVCHLHDNHGQNDEHALPGTGNINWSHILNLLEQAPRLEYIHDEVNPTRTSTSISEICRTFDAIGTWKKWNTAKTAGKNTDLQSCSQ